jgi:hypothetical protein
VEEEEELDFFIFNDTIEEMVAPLGVAIIRKETYAGAKEPYDYSHAYLRELGTPRQTRLWRRAYGTKTHCIETTLSELINRTFSERLSSVEIISIIAQTRLRV